MPLYTGAGKELPVTAAEVTGEFERPPRETFGEIVPVSSSHLRMRISPDVSIGLGVRVKSPGEHMLGHDVELASKRVLAKDVELHLRALARDRRHPRVDRCARAHDIIFGVAAGEP